MACWESTTPFACWPAQKIWAWECCSEHELIKRNNQCICLAEIDDAHFYRADNIEKAASGIPSDKLSILLSYTPEIYPQAAIADFNPLLSGHTHGGQVCLSGWDSDHARFGASPLQLRGAIQSAP
jgi:predicted MPP superfamily phosphohydrolase